MKKLFYSFLAFSILNLPSVYAQELPRDSKISPPVGGGLLPGGNQDLTHIKKSIVFSKIIPFLITYSIQLAIALSVIALIIGGYMYITAYGNEDQQWQSSKNHHVCPYWTRYFFDRLWSCDYCYSN